MGKSTQQKRQLKHKKQNQKTQQRQILEEKEWNQETRSDKKIKSDQRKELKDKKLQLVADKFQWFKEYLVEEFETVKPFSHYELAKLVESYIDRFSDAKEELNNAKIMREKLKRKTKNSLNSKQDVFEAAKELDSNKFNGSGLDVPDLMTKSGLRSLLEWDESLENLAKVKTVLAKSSWLKFEKNLEVCNAIISIQKSPKSIFRQKYSFYFRKILKWHQKLTKSPLLATLLLLNSFRSLFFPVFLVLAKPLS